MRRKPPAAYRGITLLEQLLALSVIAVILILSIQHYRIYQQRVQYESINGDVDKIFYALNTYFHQADCDTQGKFMGKAQPTLSSDLGLPNLEHGREPAIQGYSVNITLLANPSHQNKPLYQFRVTASSNLSPGKLRYLQRNTHATLSNTPDHQLTWIARPGHLEHTNSRLDNQLKNFKARFSLTASTNGHFNCVQ